jgi:proteasome assembly chaperone (PAC2) family protein
MDHVRWLVDPERIALTRPVLVAAFTGWNDAGDAASTAVQTLIESSGARKIAEIDPEHFTDFATVRPHVRLDDQHNRSIDWPTVRIWSASLPGTDVILVLGPEPALKWRSFCDQIVAVAQRFESAMGLTIGALLADVPHTRPTQIIGSATDETLIDRFELDRSRYEGPTGIIGVLHDALSRSGLATASLWAAVPGYTSQLQSPRAAMALVERACSMMGTPAPVVRLAAEVADYDAKVAALIADDDDLVIYVGRLEEMVDEMSDEDDDDSLDDDEDDDDNRLDALEDGDPERLADEVERFLRDRGRDV